MLLENKKILIMGVRNKWSIAWGVAQSAIENGAEVIFTHNTPESGEKTEKLKNTREKEEREIGSRNERRERKKLKEEKSQPKKRKIKI